MFDFFTPNHPFGGQTLRLVAQAQQGGGDIFDIARTCAKIEPGDKTGWEREWLQLAQTTEAKAKSAAPPDGGTRRFPIFSRQPVLSNVRCVSDL